MMRKRKISTRLLAIALVIALCFIYVPKETSVVFAAGNKLLSINWSHIAAVGNMEAHTQSCACFALAYCRTMLDGRVHYWSEYDYNGGGSQSSAVASWSSGSYGTTDCYSAQQAYKACYDSINNNRPAILFVEGSRSSWHYVTVVGYQNVTDENNLSASNFLIIDSVYYCSKSEVENMATAGYYAKNYDGYSVHLTDSGSVGPADSTKPVITNAKVTKITATEATIECTATDNVGINRVQFPTWTDKNGQDDIAADWGTSTRVRGTHIGNNVYQFVVKRSEHNNETGVYNTHIYAYDAAGNNASVGLQYTITGNTDTTKPVIKNVKITSITPEGATIECDITDDTGINKVEFPTWPTYKTSEGCTWYSPTSKSGNHYVFKMSINDFSNYSGGYATHIYAWDMESNSTAEGITYDIPDKLYKAGVYNGHIYRVFDATVNWTTMADNTNVYGGYKVRIESKGEQDFVYSLLNKDKRAYFIGVCDKNKNKNYTYSDGSALKYSNWAANQPDSYNHGDSFGIEYYGEMHTSNGTWNDVCDNNYLINKDAANLGYVLESDGPNKTGALAGHKYEVYDLTVTWKVAKQLAEELGGHLVKIESQEEQNYIASLIKGRDRNSYWMGVADLKETGNKNNFTYVDGSALSYANWSNGEPNTLDYGSTLGKECFGEIYTSNGQWNDKPNINHYDADNKKQKIGFIVEYDPVDDYKNTRLETVIWNDHKYEIYHCGKISWNTAKKEAEKLGGHLVTITSSEEQALVRYLYAFWRYRLDYCWLGASDEKKEGSFEWVTGEPFNINYYSDGQPDNDYGVEDYLCMWGDDGTWNDYGDFTTYSNVGMIVEYENPQIETSGMFNNHEYKVVNNCLFATNARKMQKDGWYLVTITSKEENDYVFSLIESLNDKDVAYWIGANDAEKEGSFVWDNGEEFSDEFAKTCWHEGEPNNSGDAEHYAAIFTNDGTWNDYRNDRYKGYILERNLHTEHTWDSGKVTKKPTCIEEGEMTFKCTECDETKTEPIDKIDHKSEVIKAVPVTCTEDGLTEGAKCSVCGEILTEQKVVKAKGHVYDDGEVTKEPTYEEEGVKTFTCTKCGATKTESIPKQEKTHTVHTWNDGVITTEPTCTDDGVLTYTCTECGETKTQRIRANGHSWNTGETTKEASCMSEGEILFTCTVCRLTKTETVEKTEHNIVIDKPVAATCTEKGYTAGQHCSVCNKVFQAQTEIPALGHVEKTVAEVDATCTTAGHTAYTICTRCGKVLTESTEIPAKGHSFDEGTVTKEPTETETGIRTYTCTVCQATKTETIPATGNPDIPVPDPLYVLTISGNPSVMNVGDTAKLNITFSRDLTNGDSFEWIVNNGDAISIAGDGIITAKKPGLAYIGYKLNGNETNTGIKVEVYGKLDKPVKPVIASVDVDSITVKKVEGLVYSLDGVKWQKEATFTGLEADKEYVVFAKAIGDGYYADSDISEGAIAHTEKSDEPDDKWPFRDVAEDSALAKEVKLAYDKNIISGYGAPDENGQVNFKPSKYVTRAQFAIMVYNLAGRPDMGDLTNAKGFTDVKKGSNGYNEILWASSKGIISGFDDGRFKPDKEVGRAQIAIMLKKYADYCNYKDMYASGGTDIFTFVDSNEIKKGSEESLQWAVDQGILSGTGKNKLSPNGTARRDQCAAFFARFYDKFEE